MFDDLATATEHGGTDPLERLGREALLEVAARLDALAVERAELARATRIEWRGAHRTQFDVERANRDARYADLAARCRRLAAA